MQRTNCSKNDSVRRCIITRASLPKNTMVRFVVSPDRIITPDIEEKLPGRGYWIKAERTLMNIAETKNVFPKNIKVAVKTPHNLAELVEERLFRQVTDLVSIARKSRTAVAGFEKVNAELVSGLVGLILCATDGSKRQGNKLLSSYLTTETHNCLTSCELGLAFGRKSVMYASVRKSTLAVVISSKLNRLAQFREMSNVTFSTNLETAMS